MAKVVSRTFLKAVVDEFNGDISELNSIIKNNDDVVDFAECYRSVRDETAVSAPSCRASVMIMQSIYPGDVELPVLPNPYCYISVSRLLWAFDMEVLDFESKYCCFTKSYIATDDVALVDFEIVGITPAILDATSRRIVQKGKIIVK